MARVVVIHGETSVSNGDLLKFAKEKEDWEFFSISELSPEIILPDTEIVLLSGLNKSLFPRVAEIVGNRRTRTFIVTRNPESWLSRVSCLGTIGLNEL